MKPTPVCMLLLTIGCTTAQTPIGTTELNTANIVVTSPDKPVRVSGGIAAGNIMKMVMPVFPEEARCKHIGGGVILHVLIGTDGRVIDADPISGAEVLRKPYADAVKQWTYKPFLLNGQPVEVETTVSLNPQMNATGCAQDAPQP